MRLAVVLPAMVLGVVMLGPCAYAESYPWCAIYNKGGGEISCGFVTWQQCMADVSGIGGFCQPNNTYVPTVAAPSLRHPVRHKSKAS